jgi:arginase
LRARSHNVMFAGLHGASPMETAFIEQHGLRRAAPEELAISSAPVLDWLRDIGAKRLAIHFDLDVLDPALFHSLLFCGPEAAAGTFQGVPVGKMTISQVTRLLQDVGQVASVVGLAITEHMPWDSLALAQMLASLPLVGSPKANPASRLHPSY